MTDFPEGTAPAPERSERIFNIPAVILCLIVTMGAIHAWRETISDDSDLRVISLFAFVPARISYFLDATSLNGLLARVAQGSEGALQEAQLARYFLRDGLAAWSFVTHAFLHGDWTHFGLNALWLTAFGSAVARRFGWLRFLMFAALAAAAGALAHFAAHPYDFAPMIGASGAVSGAMAGAARFAFQPGAPLGETGSGIGARAGAPWHQPALSLPGIFKDRRTLTFLGVWLAVNFIFGIIAQPLGITQSPIAWEAHAGGFAAGLLLFGLFDRRQPAAS